MSARRIVLALALVAGTAACGDALTLPAGPSFNGGHTLGSGGGVPGGGSDPGTTTTASDSLGRSGHTLGSGG